MYQWERQIQSIVDEIDRCIRQQDSEALTLQALSRRLGYSESYTTRKFGEISGMRLRVICGAGRLAFALKEVRDSEKSLLDIALAYGFSSQEAFTRGLPASLWRAPGGVPAQPQARGAAYQAAPH